MKNSLVTVSILTIIFASLAMLIIAMGWAYFLYKSVRLKGDKQNGSEEEKIELLKLEFEYARESSLQAQRDRLTLVNFYIGLYAAISTLSFGLKEITTTTTISEYIPFVFIGLGGISYIFIILLVRLRQAWLESIKAMNVIKSYFIERNKDIENYIIWTIETMPKAEKFKTINYLSSILIALLGGSALGIGMILGNAPTLLYTLVAPTFSLISIVSYHLMLKYRA